MQCSEDDPVVQPPFSLSSFLFLALSVCIHLIDKHSPGGPAWVYNPADLSAFSKAKVEQWVRVPVHQDSLAAPSAYSRTNRTPSNGLPEMPVDEADNMWGVCGDEQILQAATADPFGMNTTTSPTTDRGPSSWSISWKWPRSSWRSSSGVNNLADEVEDSEDGPVVQPLFSLSSFLFPALSVCIHLIDTRPVVRRTVPHLISSQFTSARPLGERLVANRSRFKHL